MKIDDVTVPLCAIACETDHIAAWRSSYRGIRQMGSKDKTFILSESGHIAGIVNPPSKKKYGHYTNADWPDDPDDWQAGRDVPRRHLVVPLGRMAGGAVGQRWSRRAQPGDSSIRCSAPAPGTYVVQATNV